MESWQQIRALHAQGGSVREIARQLGISRNTVTKALSETAPPKYRRPASAGASLAPFAAQLLPALRRGVQGLQLLADARGLGYTGSPATFYRWLAQERAALRPPQACIRFETDPGAQAQFDWAEYRLELGDAQARVYVYQLLLGYSRAAFFYPSLASDQPAVFEALEAGWRYFGGACRDLLIDNPKVFVIQAGKERVWNRNFLALCGLYGVNPVTCRPRHPQSKGKVENPFGHLEGGVLTGNSWPSFEALAAAVADYSIHRSERPHATTGEAPRVRFERDEASLLLPLPSERFLLQLAEFRRASRDSLISFAGSRFSVPCGYASKQVLATCEQGRTVVIYSTTGVEVARHAKPSRRCTVIENEHYTPLRRRQQAGSLEFCCRRFRERFPGEMAANFLQRLLAREPYRPALAVSRVVDLLTAVPAEVAQAVLAECLEINQCTYTFVEASLHRRPTPPPPPGQPLAQMPLPSLDVERPLTDYGRALPSPTS